MTRDFQTCGGGLPPLEESLNHLTAAGLGRQSTEARQRCYGIGIVGMRAING